jgi:hypothetical protein
VALAIYIKRYLQGERRITETQIFHHAKIYLTLRSVLSLNNPQNRENENL